MFIIERIAHSHTLNGVHPMLKFIFMVGSLGMVLSSRGLLAPVIFLMVMSGIIIVALGTGVRAYLKLLAVPGSFIMLGSLAMLVSVDSGPDAMDRYIAVFGVYIGIGRGNLIESLHLCTRSFAAASSMYVFLLSTPQHEFDFILKKLMVPSVMREMCMLVYRNIFIFIETAESIYTSQRLRLGYAHFARGLRSSGGLVAGVFVKSLDFGRRSYVAMRARGYLGEFVFAGEEHRFRTPHVLGAAIVGALLFVATVWSRL